MYYKKHDMYYKKHYHRKRVLQFLSSTNMLNIRSNGFDHARCYWDYVGVGLANLSKQIASTSNW